MTIIKCGENPENYTREIVGGKGLNLLRLHQAAQKSEWYSVPEFFIIPVDSIASHGFSKQDGVMKVTFKSEDVESAFSAMKKPVIARSSYTLEDGINASFAGIFESIPDIHTFDELRASCDSICNSANTKSAENYIARMGIEKEGEMAYIVQKQITDFLMHGIIEIEGDNFALEEVYKSGDKSLHEERLSWLKEIYGDKPWFADACPGHTCEGHFGYLPQAAEHAAKDLGLTGKVQVEFLFKPGKKVEFVQIRQLPKVQSRAIELNVKIPKKAPYIESEICNDVPGELILPAYVTFSQAGFKRILIEIGQGFSGVEMDKRTTQFMRRSKLARNHDFFEFEHLCRNEHAMLDLGERHNFIQSYNALWAHGNRLFEDYILICDKLDDSVAEMNNATTNKRTIITTREVNRTSHAMTVARDLEIPCMCVDSDIMDLKSFYNQVQTGDIVHMKSNGKKAIAWVEKRRKKNPYENLDRELERELAEE